MHNIDKKLCSRKADFSWNPMSANFWSSFATEPDTYTPVVISTIPNPGETDVPVIVSIVAYFSEELDPSTVNTSTFLVWFDTPGNFIAGTVTYLPCDPGIGYPPKAIFDPYEPLLDNTTFNAILLGSPPYGIRDITGNPLVPDTGWSFTTENILPPSAPTGSVVTLQTGIIRVLIRNNLIHS